MSEEEILRYIFSCVSYKHMFDLSPRITDSAQKKEDLLFSSAVFFLRELGKGKNVFEENLERAFKRIVELEVQIEKMKCCYNCRHSRTEYEHCKTDKHEKWEIKEK